MLIQKSFPAVAFFLKMWYDSRDRKGAIHYEAFCTKYRIAAAKSTLHHDRLFYYDCFLPCPALRFIYSDSGEFHSRRKSGILRDGAD